MDPRPDGRVAESVAIGVLGVALLPAVVLLLLIVSLPYCFNTTEDPEVDDSVASPSTWLSPKERRAGIVHAAASVLAREFGAPRRDTPELLVVDVRDGERWGRSSGDTVSDSGGTATWRFGRLPDPSLPDDGAWHLLWSDGALALEWQCVEGTLRVREVCTAGTNVGLRTLVSFGRSFRGLHIPARDDDDNVIFEGPLTSFTPMRWPRPLGATLLLEQREGEVVVDLTLGSADGGAR